MLNHPESLEAAAKALTFRCLTADQWRMWRAVMRRQPQWFVLRCTRWSNDRWRAVAGPFSSPEEARAGLARLSAAATSARPTYRWQVATLTETMHIYRGNVPLLVDDLTEAEGRPSQPVAP